MHDAPLPRKGRSVGTGWVLEGEDSAWRWGWVSGLHGVLTQRMRVHCTPYTRRAGGLKAVCEGPAHHKCSWGAALSSTTRRCHRDDPYCRFWCLVRRFRRLTELDNLGGAGFAVYPPSPSQQGVGSLKELAHKTMPRSCAR